MLGQPPKSTHFPYTPLFRSVGANAGAIAPAQEAADRLPGRLAEQVPEGDVDAADGVGQAAAAAEPEGVLVELLGDPRSEEHTSELQSRQYLVCRLLLETQKHPNFDVVALFHQYEMNRRRRAPQTSSIQHLASPALSAQYWRPATAAVYQGPPSTLLGLI